jgi:hypothetical protein
MANQTEHNTASEFIEPIINVDEEEVLEPKVLSDEPILAEINKNKAPTIGFRVNRQGKEIFNGGKVEFEQAVKAQKIRADDLIWDNESNSWTFARNHAIFRSSNQEALDILLKKRRAKERKTWIMRGLMSFIVISGMMWVLVHYSKKIEFNPREAGGFADSSEMPQENKDQKSKDDGATNVASNGSMMDNIELNDLELEKITKNQEKQNQEEIEMVFDLNADGNQSFLENLNQNESLSNKKLLEQAQKLLDYPGVSLQDSNAALQEAFGIVDFVLNRSKRENKNDQTKTSAQNLQRRIESKYKTQCDQLHGADFCTLKLKHMTWSDQTITAITQNKILIGMNQEQAMESWGNAIKEVNENKNINHCYDANCKKYYKTKLNKVVAFANE